MFHMPVPLRQLALILLLPVLLLACSTAGPAVDAAPDGDKDSRIEAPADDNGSPGDEDEEDSGSEDETGSDEDSEDSTGDAPGDEGDDAEEPGDEDSDVDEPGEASVSIPGFSFTPDPFDFGEGISQAWLLPLADLQPGDTTINVNLSRNGELLADYERTFEGVATVGGLNPPRISWDKSRLTANRLQLHWLKVDEATHYLIEVFSMGGLLVFHQVFPVHIRNRPRHPVLICDDLPGHRFGDNIDIDELVVVKINPNFSFTYKFI